MTALRMRARDFLTDDQLAAVRQRVTWKGVALIAQVVGVLAVDLDLDDRLAQVGDLRGDLIDFADVADDFVVDALLNAGRYNEALAVLQKDLQVNPSNGWALSGLQTAFEKLNRSGDVSTAKQRLKNAWLVKDVEITRPVF